jgi:hypothetical protein
MPLMVKYFIKNITKINVKKNYIKAIIFSKIGFKIISLNSSLLFFNYFKT